MRASRSFSALACAAAPWPGASIKPAAVSPAPAVLKKSRRSRAPPLAVVSLIVVPSFCWCANTAATVERLIAFSLFAVAASKNNAAVVSSW